MASQIADLDRDLSGLTLEDWREALDDMGDEHGFCEGLGADHAALFVEQGRQLLVTFETMEAARALPGARPRGFEIAAREGWSLLALLSDGQTWFRADPVYRTFDRWSDEGFFDDFDRVLFLGAGAGGYAAAAFSVAAPGARVLAIRPQATLDPSVTGWDRRFTAERRRDFTSRYGYAPEMIDGAECAHVIHDPLYAPDAMHAALFRRPNVTALRAALTGSRLEQVLDQLGLIPGLARAAMAGTLTPVTFARAWRARRESAPYLRMLLKRLQADERPGLAARVCRHGLTTRDRAFFAAQMGDAKAPLAGAAE